MHQGVTVSIPSYSARKSSRKSIVPIKSPISARQRILPAIDIDDENRIGCNNHDICSRCRQQINKFVIDSPCCDTCHNLVERRLYKVNYKTAISDYGFLTAPSESRLSRSDSRKRRLGMKYYRLKRNYRRNFNFSSGFQGNMFRVLSDPQSDAS